MIVRDIKPEDMPEIFSWFEKKRWPYPPVERVAPEWGFVAEKDGRKLACAFAYLTGTSIAFIDWTATNPEVDESVTVKALVDVIEKMKEIFQAISPKVSAMCLATPNKRLAERFEKTGFRKQEGFYRCLWVAK